MSRTDRIYRKVECATWHDEAFLELSAPKPNAQTLWMYLLTGPRTTIIPGVIVARPAIMADDLRWPLRGFQKALDEIVDKGLAKVDPAVGLVVLPKALMHRGTPRPSSKPSSENAIKSWATSWLELPDCALKHELRETLLAFTLWISEKIASVFAETIAVPKTRNDPFPNYGMGDSQNTETPLPSALRMQDAGSEDPEEPARARTRDPGGPVPAQAHPPPAPVLRAVPSAPDPDPRGTQRKAIIAAIAPLHARVFNTVREDLGLQVRAMQPVGDPAERALRDLLAALPSLEGVEDDCRHVLAVREAEARRTRSVQYLGASVWSMTPFGKAKVLSVEEAQRGNTGAAGGIRAGPPAGFAALLAAATPKPGDSS